MNVGEICNREVIIAERTNSVREAARLMREYNVGDIVVVEMRDGLRVPVGILTDRDIVVEIIAADVDLDAVELGEVMSGTLLTASVESEILETVKRMRTEGVRRLPVVNAAGGLEGILTLDDLLPLLAEQLSDLVGLVACEQKRERLKTGEDEKT